MKRVKTALRHPLIAGSGILLFGSIFGNFFNFFFNLFMSRNLSVIDYGVLASLVSVITLPGMIGGAVLPTVIHFASEYFANERIDMVRGLFIKVFKLLVILGLIIVFIFSVFSEQIGGFFNIHNSFLIILASILVFISFITVVNNALLQAKLAFGFISFNSQLSAFIKLGMGVLLVYAGFSVNGAIFALILAALIPYFVSFIPLRFLFSGKFATPHIHTTRLFAYGVPSALCLFGLNSFITNDILLVKHFFSPSDAGLYAGLSLVGRVIFFATAPINMVMFPLITQRHARKESYNKLFFFSLFFVFLTSASLTVGYFLFPELMIHLFLKNADYLKISSYLGVFAIFITIYSLLSVIINFYLSVKETKIVYPVVIAAIIQALLITIFHQSILQVLWISLLTSSLLLIVLLIYYGKVYERHIK